MTIFVVLWTEIDITDSGCACNINLCAVFNNFKISKFESQVFLGSQLCKYGITTQCFRGCLLPSSWLISDTVAHCVYTSRQVCHSSHRF